MSQDSAATNTPNGPVAPGELCWLEVPCVDPERAFSFYQAVFGWAKPCNADGPIPGYGEGIDSIHTFMHGKLYGAFVKMNNADNVAVTVDQELPFKMPITPYLLVADIDKTAVVVAASGGKVHV
jgi:predicted enzyme related to lactoylglutathione lyase